MLHVQKAVGDIHMCIQKPHRMKGYKICNFYYINFFITYLSYDSRFLDRIKTRYAANVGKIQYHCANSLGHGSVTERNIPGNPAKTTM
jgi:hypothetical protein